MKLKLLSFISLSLLTLVSYAHETSEVSKETIELLQSYQDKADEFKQLADDYKKKVDHLKQQCNIERKPWKGSNASLGVVYNTGDTTTRSANGGFVGVYNEHPWQFKLNGTAQIESSQDKGLTSQKFYLMNQNRYNFAEKNFGYVQFDYTNDRFSGYTFVLNEQIGYGRRLVKTDTQSFDVLVGPGLQQRREIESKGGEFENNPTLSATLDYNWEINHKTYFHQDIGSTWTKLDIITNATTSLVTTLTDNIGLKLSFNISHNTSPLPNKSHVNTTSNLSFVYNF